MSRTREAPTPTNISTKSEPEIVKNGTLASPAMARASSVLPVPGEPTISTPRGILPPSRWNLAGSLRNSTISPTSSFASSTPATSANVTLTWSSSEQPRAALAERHGAAAARPALHLAHEVHPDADQQQDRERGDEQLHQERLPLRRRGAELDAVLLQRPDQRGVVGLGVVDDELLAAGARCR